MYERKDYTMLPWLFFSVSLQENTPNSLVRKGDFAFSQNEMF